MHLRFILLTILSLVLTSCASQPTGGRQAKNPDLGISIVSNRQLNLEPCGCSFRPLGGIVREWEFLTRFKHQGQKQLLHLSAGTTFSIPVDGLKMPTPQMLLKGRLLVEALNKMNTSAIALSHQDFQFGMDNLKAMSAKANFPFVATNLSAVAGQKAFWEPRYTLSKDNYEVVVFALSGIPQGVPGVGWDDPFTVLRKEMAQLPKRENRLVVVLSSLSTEEDKKLQEEFPGVNIFVRTQSDPSASFSQVSRQTLVSSALDTGMKVSAASFTFGSAMDGLYSPDVAEIYQEALQNDQLALAKLERQIASVKSKKARKASESERQSLHRRLEMAQNVLSATPDRSASYSAGIIDLDSVYEPFDPNPMAEIVEKYFTEVRQYALNEEE